VVEAMATARPDSIAVMKLVSLSHSSAISSEAGVKAFSGFI
jgi:hypothetical protein